MKSREPNPVPAYVKGRESLQVAKNWREMFSVVKNGGKASQWSKKEGK